MSLATPGNVQFQAVDDLLGSRCLGRQDPRSQGIKVDRDQGTKAPQRPATAAEKSVRLEPDSSGLPVRLKPDLREGPRSQARSRLQLTWESSSSRHHHHPGTKAYWHREHLGTQHIQGPSRPRFPAPLVPRRHGSLARQVTTTIKDPRRIGPWPTLRSSFTTGQGIELSKPSGCPMRHQQLGSQGPRDSGCLAGLGGPGHWWTKSPAGNRCQGSMKPRSTKGQFRPGTNPADEAGAASFEQELGGVETLDP
jgi:hypothetical protein